MQHQSQGLSKGPTAGKTGLYVDHVVISGEEIERHIAAGKRMQAEAIAAFLSGLFRRLGLLFQRRAATSSDTAMPHGA
jgi:hypothetical protein